MILEYEAKAILQKHLLPVPNSKLVSVGTSIDLPVVLKSQVPVGGRGKLGGIIVVHTDEESIIAVDKLLTLEIKGFTPSVLLAEALLDIKHEYYLSILFDRENTAITLVASKDGGVEVESSNDDSFMKLSLSFAPNFDRIGQSVAEWLDLPSQAFSLSDMIEKLFHCFKESDATLIEINPLILTTSEDLVIADCKIILDDSARFRHPEWQELNQQPTDVNFVTLDPNGNVATVANGAGLAMATVDAVREAGFTPANFLDIGGGANEASVIAAFERIMETTSAKAIIINIFAGITRCDEVAKAIISAKKKIQNLPPLFIRLSGTNSDDANALLDTANISHAASLENCIVAAQEVTQ